MADSCEYARTEELWELLKRQICPFFSYILTQLLRMVEFLIIATMLRHLRELLYGDYSKIFLPCEINNLLYWRKMFSLFILKTKTFHICLICCCHSQDNHLSTFKKTRALQTSQTKLLFLVAAIWSRLSCSSLRRIDPS